jgi:hypothetical protein
MEEIQYKDHTIKIIQDDDSESPREWDNLGKMVCKHRDYKLGDEQIPEDYFSDKLGDTVYLDNLKEVQNWITEIYGKIAVILPLYLYDHSGISISTSDNYPYNDRWDSSTIGFIFVTYEMLRKEYNKKRVSKRMIREAKRILMGEVETYDQYLTGDVWGYDTEEDSCWGYYGQEDAISEAKQAIDYQIKEENRKHQEQLKKYIQNNVSINYRFI